MLPIDTKIRVAVAITPGTTTTNGRIEYAYWSDITSSTPTYSFDTGNTVNTGTTQSASFFIGRSTTRAQATKTYYNVVRAKHLASGWLAPYTAANTQPVITNLIVGSPTVEAGDTLSWSANSSDTDIVSYTHRIISSTNSAPIPTLISSGALATATAPATLNGTTYTVGSTATDSGGLTSAEKTSTITVLPSSRRVKIGSVIVPVISYAKVV